MRSEITAIEYMAVLCSDTPDIDKENGRAEHKDQCVNKRSILQNR